MLKIVAGSAAPTNQRRRGVEAITTYHVPITVLETPWRVIVRIGGLCDWALGSAVPGPLMSAMNVSDRRADRAEAGQRALRSKD